MCKIRKLPVGGAKNERMKRILDDCPWEELLPILLSTDRLEWWQLLFLQPILMSGASREEILESKFVATVLKDVRRTFDSDPRNFLDRKMKFLLRSGLVLKSRKGWHFSYSINEVLRRQLQLSLSNLTFEDVLKRYRKSAEYQFSLKYHRPGAGVQTPSVELEANPPQFIDPSAQLTRVVAFSDYRVQDIDLLLEFLKGLNPKPDLILYSGDDVDRFGTYSSESLKQLLASATARMGSIQRVGGPGLYSFLLPGTYIDSESISQILAQRISHHARVSKVLTPAFNVPKEQASDGKWLSARLQTALQEAGVSSSKVSVGAGTSYIEFDVDSDEFNGRIAVFSPTKQGGLSTCMVSSVWLTFASRHLDGANLDDLQALTEALGSKFQVLLQGNGRGGTKGLVYASTGGRNLLEEVASYSHYGICAVIGNDDDGSVRELIAGNKVYDVHKAPVILGQYAVLGLEGGPIRPGEPNPGIVMYSEDEIEQHLSSFERYVEGKRLIVVSHPPPYEILDHALRFGDRNIGSESMRDFVAKHPDTRLLVCGHVHHCGGMTARTPNGALVVNAASHDNFGEPGKIAIIDIDTAGEMQVNWHFIHELPGLFGVGRKTAEKLRKAGIRRVEDLLELKFTWGIDGLSSSFMTTLSVRARAIVEGRPQVLSGFDLPGRPATYLDIETDVEQTVVWLVGVHSERSGQSRSFFANDPKEERTILLQLSEFGQEDSGKNDPIYYYSCNNFDKRVLEARFRTHGIEQNITERMVDLCPRVRNAVALPLKSYSLKDLAQYFHYEYKHQGLDGWAVAMMYFGEYLKDKDPATALVLKEYNQDDVLFLPQLVKQIEGLMKDH